MKTHLLHLFNYDYWANERMINTLLENQVADEKIHHWISHLVNAEQIWWDRMQNRIPRVTVDDIHPLDVAQRMLVQVNQDIITWLEYAREEILEDEVTYRNSKGDTFTNTISDILTHIVNHSTHHRAQIASRLREQGIAPPATDYIFYRRGT